jgi:signal transduction histidine kinase
MLETEPLFAKDARYIVRLVTAFAALLGVLIALGIPLAISYGDEIAALKPLFPDGILDLVIVAALLGTASFGALQMFSARAVRRIFRRLADAQRIRTEAHARGKAAEQGMFRASARLMDAIEAIPGGFLLLDAEDRIVLSNTAYRRLYGLDANPILPGAHFDHFLQATAQRGLYETGGQPTDSWIAARMAWHRSASDKDDCFAEHFADGRWIEVRERRTRGGGIVGTRRDVTLTRQQEKTEREREKLAALGQLAGGIAHEINNLLQPALTFPELICDRLPADDLESREDLDMILASAKQARDIVRGILLYARKQDPALLRLDLAAETRTALDFIRKLLPPGISLRMENLHDGTMAAVNKTQLVQILTNLLVNAGDAMNGQGSIIVTLDETHPSLAEASALGLATDRPYFTLTITDDGCGMDKAVESRIFEPFFTTKPIGRGTGLGLSVVYGILRSWGGAIAVTSALGQGTTFTLYIPTAPGNDLSIKQPQIAAA